MAQLMHNIVNIHKVYITYECILHVLFYMKAVFNKNHLYVYILNAKSIGRNCGCPWKRNAANSCKMHLNFNNLDLTICNFKTRLPPSERIEMLYR